MERQVKIVYLFHTSKTWRAFSFKDADIITKYIKKQHVIKILDKPLQIPKH